MNQDIKQRWVAALRSGEYQQGEAMLCTPDDKFCCLGVLCDLHRKETAQFEWVPSDGEGKRYADEPSYLPGVVHQWAEIHDLNPETSGGHFLSDLNDTGKSFAEIADIIEREL